MYLDRAAAAGGFAIFHLPAIVANFFFAKFTSRNYFRQISNFLPAIRNIANFTSRHFPPSAAMMPPAARRHDVR